MPSPTLSAAELLVGFDLGLFARADVARWVDEEVERLDTLPEALLELTTMRHRHDVDVLRWLGELASVDDVTRARLELAALSVLVGARRLTPRNAAQIAPRIAMRISDALYYAALYVDDRFDLADIGHASLEEAEADVNAFLAAHAGAGEREETP